VFITPERLFEPIVMFFSLMNLLATFQTIMNEILWNLINTGKVASFIDNVIISTEMKEVVKRLAKNNLYVKSEKCK